MDAPGNKISGFGEYKFTIDSDSVGPIVQTNTLPSGTGVAPWTTVTLQMDENIQTGTGSVSLTAPKGLDVSIPVEDFTIALKSAWASLPTGSVLTEGQVYTINVQAGNFKDAANNNGAASTGRTFTVLSGSVSASGDSYTGELTNNTVAGTGNATADVTAPTLSSSTPLADATDVPHDGDGTKKVMPAGVLKKGGTFTVSVPAGLIR